LTRVAGGQDLSVRRRPSASRFAECGPRRPAWPALLLVAALAAAGCARGLDAPERMARAQDFVASGQYRAAMIELKNVLAADPGNAQARLLLARAELELGDAAAAEKELRRAEELGIPGDVVLVPRARALVELGEAARALELLDAEAIAALESRAEALAVRADAQRMLGRGDAARTDYVAALAVDARSLPALLGLAQLEADDGAVAEAERRFAEAVEAHPDAPDARVARGRWYVERQRFDDAQADFEAALARMPDGLSSTRMEGLAGLAEAQLGRHDAAAAQETIERLAGIAGGHPLTEFLRARLAFDARDYAAAAAYLDDVLSKAPEYAPAKLLQGAVNLASGNYAKAEMYLKSVVVGDPDNVQARKMLAAARLGMRQPQGALEALRPAQGAADASLLAMLGQASVRAGAYDDGLDYLERSLGADPDNPSVQLELAAGYLAAGRVEQAIAALEAVPDAQGAALMRRELLLVLALARKQDWDGARARAHALAERFPDEPMTYNLRGSVELAAGDLAAARAEFERAAALAPDGVTPVLNLARVDDAAGDPDAAYARLEAFVQREPEDLLALLALAELDERRGALPAAVEHLRRAAGAHADAVQPRLGLARLLMRSGDNDGALASAQEAVKIKPESPAVQTALGVVQLALGRNEEALTSFRKTAAMLPRSADAQYNVARALVGLGRRVQAREALERALALDAGHIPAGTLMAKLALESGRPEDALAIAARLEAAHPDSAAPSVLRGDVHAARAQYAEAARYYAAALERAPDRGLVVRLYEARRAAGGADARDALTAWLAARPDDVSVRLVLGQAEQDAGNPAAAAAAYERVLAAVPDNAVALNNLAWLYAERGDARALAMAERAHAAAPDSGEVTDTLGWLLVQRGDIDRALPLLRDAAERAPDVPEIRYHLAVALVRDGATEEARTLLHGLLESPAEFESKSQARALLDGL
jgi:putative PEP-CTERM system TPR-repeat lipoprotein